MTNIIILTGSARPNSAGKNIAKIVADEINSRSGASAEIVLVDELDLPFFNAPFSPSADEFEITDSNVKAWSDKVKSADAVIWLMPEYNNSISAIQKNAIDWLYQEWANKPLGVIAYGRYAGVNGRAGMMRGHYALRLLSWRPPLSPPRCANNCRR